MYTYGLPQWLMFFYLYCFAGWIFESAYVMLRMKHFVNRGCLRAPMLPLYGTGAVVMLWVSIPVRGNLVLTYLAGVIGATVLEYVVGVGMEALFKVKYWDYSKQKIQFRGYICLSSSLFWGVLTIALVRFLHSPVERFVLRQPDWLAFTGVSLFTAGFACDLAVSAKEALNLRKVLVAMEKLRAEMDEVQRELSLKLEQGYQTAAGRLVQTRENLASHAKQRRGQLADRWIQGRAALASHVEQSRGQLEQRLAALTEQKEMQLGEFQLAHRRLRRRHPSATTGKLEEWLAGVKRREEGQKEEATQES